MVQQLMHRTFMELGLALFAPVLYFSLVLNAAEIFLCVPNRKEGHHYASIVYVKPSILSGYSSPMLCANPKVRNLLDVRIRIRMDLHVVELL
jgi:hypothetical protein